jgi:peptidoglycan/LPS O-acetylase OafA/YrhL
MSQPLDRRNNFDLIRLVAASSVIFTHAFLIAEGEQNRDPMVVLTQNQCATGLVGVFVFFVISGFLVTQSWEQTNSLPRYLAKRALRIYPGYAVCILALTFGLGAAMTTLPLGDYLRDPRTHDFLVANLNMGLQPNALPGVQFSQSWFGTVMDGPLWSLPLEVSLYVMVALLGLTRSLRVPVLAVLLALGVFEVAFDHWIDKTIIPWIAEPHLAGIAGFLAGVLWMLPFFATGMLAYKLRDRGIFDGRLALAAAAVLVGAVILANALPENALPGNLHRHTFIPTFSVCGCYLALYVALHPRLPAIPAARWGDLSYGLYIYGWPVEQTIAYLRPGASWWELFLLSMLATGAVAFLSWHLIEKRALSLKPRCAARTEPAPA